MTSIQQRAELHRQIWQIANDVRGSVDGWDFKQYVLGALFYRFISENFSSYIEAGDDSICYAKLDDSVITDDIKDDAIKTKGYFIYPSQLFCNVAAKANTNDRLNADLTLRMYPADQLGQFLSMYAVKPGPSGRRGCQKFLRKVIPGIPLMLANPDTQGLWRTANLWSNGTNCRPL